jgi:hypothetical protein
MVLMTSSVNHIVGETELTLITYISKNGGFFELKNMTVSEKGFGWYLISLSIEDTNTLGELVLHIEAENADPTDVLLEVKEVSIEEFSLFVDEIHTLQGLKNIASTTNKLTNKWIAGDIVINMSGDGVEEFTMQRGV